MTQILMDRRRKKICTFLRQFTVRIHMSESYLAALALVLIFFERT